MENIDTIVTTPAASSIQNRTAHWKELSKRHMWCVCVCARSEYKFVCTRPFQTFWSTQIAITSIFLSNEMRSYQNCRVHWAFNWVRTTQCKHSQWSNNETKIIFFYHRPSSLHSSPCLWCPFQNTHTHTKAEKKKLKFRSGSRFRCYELWRIEYQQQCGKKNFVD